MIMALAIGLLAWWWVRADTALVRVGLAICLGGALSTSPDRVDLRRGGGFLSPPLGLLVFYIFNLADTAITVGVIF